jgi:hypothetical protein
LLKCRPKKAAERGEGGMNSMKRKTSEKQSYVTSRSDRDWAIKQPGGETSRRWQLSSICQGHSGSAHPPSPDVPLPGYCRSPCVLSLAFTP